jgi:nucleoid-associated protein YejK
MSNKKQTAVQTIIKYCEEKLRTDVNSHRGAYTNVINFCKTQAKAIEKKQNQNLKAEIEKLRERLSNYYADEYHKAN